MACSCRIKKQIQYSDPATGRSEQLSLEKFSAGAESDSHIQNKPSKKTYAQIGRSIDTSATTLPSQLCFNCVRKHLGMAHKFLQHKDIQHFLASIGQLLCVVQHLKALFPNTAYAVRDKALYMLRRQERSYALRNVEQLIMKFQYDLQQDLPQYVPLPSFPQEQELLTVLLVQSLLFVQLGYQQVNKTWATAQLSFFSYNTFRTTNALKYYETYRPLWKLIQSMQFMDQNYLAARDYIHSILISKYPYYQQIVLPKMKDQLQQNYKKQEELMHKLQKQQQPLPQPS